MLRQNFAVYLSLVQHLAIVLLVNIPGIVYSQENLPSSPLNVEHFKHYIEEFNKYDNESVVNHFSNVNSWKFLRINIPFFECPDKDIEKTYYFRWWTYRKHIKYVPFSAAKPPTIAGSEHPFFVVTEFLPPVSWGGLHNTIPCAGAHHIREGRWLRDQTFLDDYARFWIRERDTQPRRYSFWITHSLRARAMITGNTTLLQELYSGLVANFRARKVSNYETKVPNRNGLYFNTDNRDGMESSIGGGRRYGDRGYRPTLNSYEYGEAFSLAKIAQDFGHTRDAAEFAQFARDLKLKVENILWDKNDTFFKVLPYAVPGKKKTESPQLAVQEDGPQLVDVRELIGYTPFYFNLASVDKLEAWKFLMRGSGNGTTTTVATSTGTGREGFTAPYGLTTAEQNHPEFQGADYSRGHECLWNGPVWPYATSMTLTALGSAYNMYGSLLLRYISKQDVLNTIHTYAASHKLYREDLGKYVSWIDENINPYTGDWISRTILKRWEAEGKLKADKGGSDRGKDYNHSTFIDIVLSVLLGIRGRPNDVLVINPMLPDNVWDYFCVQRLRYHGRDVTIMYDRNGGRYQFGGGLSVIVNGKIVITGQPLQKLKLTLTAY